MYLTDKSFAFHARWFEVLFQLPTSTRLQVYDAIVEYALNGSVCDMTSKAASAFDVIRKDIDLDKHRAESIRKKRSEAGKKHSGNQHSTSDKGGANKKNKINWNMCSRTTIDKGIGDDSDLEKWSEITNGENWNNCSKDRIDKGVEANQAVGTSVPNLEQVFQSEWNKCSKLPINKGRKRASKNGTSVPNDLNVEKESPLNPLNEESSPTTPKEVNSLISPIEKQKNITRTREKNQFVKPTIEEIKAYCEEKGYVIDAEYFFNFYEACGWVQGKARKPIKSWKACIVTWLRMRNEQNERIIQDKRRGSDVTATSAKDYEGAF